MDWVRGIKRKRESERRRLLRREKKERRESARETEMCVCVLVAEMK